MTVWQLAGIWFGLAVYPVAWFLGGRPERFGAGVLLLGGLLAGPANAWEVNGLYPAWVALDGAILLIFGWLGFQSDRWWPLVAATGYGLIVLGQVIRLVDPAFSHYALVSSNIGLGYVVDLALLLGVWERWLAGERSAGRAAWARAERTAAARSRGRRPTAPPIPPRPSAP